MNFYHNSRDIRCREPFGAVRQNTSIVLRAKSPFPVTLRLWQESGETLIPMKRRRGSWWEATISRETQGLLWYYFIADEKIYCAPLDLLGGESILHNDGKRLDSHQITVYAEDFSPPKWLRESVMYQIFTDRFFDGCNGELLKKRSDIVIHSDKTEIPFAVIDESEDNPEVILTNDFYGGNLPGIAQKLGYLKDMGFSAIYLNPIFEASSNHKYDTADYHNIDPTFGDNAAFEQLCEKADGEGIKIILDGVFSHTGADSIYFNKTGKYGAGGAYNDKNSPYYKWYTFTDKNGGYDSWWGFKSLPNVNEMEPDYIDFIARSDDAVVKKWLRLGASGWRLDVADELPDEFIETLRKNIKRENEQAAIIGEVWEDATNKVSYEKLRSYALGSGLDSVMNYPLRDALIAFFLGKEDSKMLKRRLDSQMENYPKEMYYSLMNLLGTHDRSRIINILGECDDQSIPRCEQRNIRMSAREYSAGKRRLKAMAQIIFALPGMPCIYYGDEAGLQGMRDPFCRAFFPWGREDKPLQNFFKRLITNRKLRPVLQTGFVAISAPEADVIEIRRYFKDGLDAFGDPQKKDEFILRVERK